jgi:MFS family permease
LPLNAGERVLKKGGIFSRELILLFIVTFVMSLGMNLTNSLWPLYVQSLGATVLQVSFVISATGLVGTLLRLPSGYISDLYGRRRIIFVSILLAVFPPLLYTFSTHWEQLILWATLYSIAFALYMPSRMAIIADYTPIERRTRVYSIMNLAMPLGSLIGPTIGGFLEHLHGWNVIFYCATVLYIFCLIPSFMLPNPSRSEQRAKRESDIEKPKLDFAFVRPLIVFFLLNLFTGLGMGTVNSLTPIYVRDRFHVSTGEVGLFISIGFGLTTMLTQIPAGIFAERLGRKKFIALCLMSMPILFVLWTVINNFLLLLLVQMALNGLWSMTWPGQLSLLMEHVSGTRRGVATGLSQTGIMLGFTLGPTIGGFLWETYGNTIPYYASALFFTICLTIIPFIREQGQNSP